MGETIRQRHSASTASLVILMILYAAISVYLIYISKYAICAIWGFATEENAQKFFYFQHDMVDLFVNGFLAMGILYAINAIGTFLIIKWKKLGYWIVLGASILALLIDVILLYNGGNTSDGIAFCIASILSPIILWAVLQFKSESQSCWKLLK